MGKEKVVEKVSEEVQKSLNPANINYAICTYCNWINLFSCLLFII